MVTGSGVSEVLEIEVLPGFIGGVADVSDVGIKFALLIIYVTKLWLEAFVLGLV